jgi:hypothetical protein
MDNWHPNKGIISIKEESWFRKHSQQERIPYQQSIQNNIQALRNIDRMKISRTIKSHPYPLKLTLKIISKEEHYIESNSS